MSKDDEIRSIAYRIWEEEGRPEGREIEHWRRAEEIWQEQAAPRGDEAEAIDPTSNRFSAASAARQSRRERAGGRHEDLAWATLSLGRHL